MANYRVTKAPVKILVFTFGGCCLKSSSQKGLHKCLSRDIYIYIYMEFSRYICTICAIIDLWPLNSKFAHFACSVKLDLGPSSFAVGSVKLCHQREVGRDSAGGKGFISRFCALSKRALPACVAVKSTHGQQLPLPPACMVVQQSASSEITSL